MDDKHKAVQLFRIQCELFWQWLLVRIGLRTWTIEERYKWQLDWAVVTEEYRRLRQ